MTNAREFRNGLGSAPRRPPWRAGAGLPAALALCCGWWWLTLRLALGAQGFDPAKLGAMGVEMDRAIVQHQLPGGVLWLESKGRSYHQAFGSRALLPQVEAMTEDTIFDVASLTKVLATAPALMILVERGVVKLDESVGAYLPEFKHGEKQDITLRQLLTHTAGLPRAVRGFIDWSDARRALEALGAEPPVSVPGTAFAYSDLNFIILGEVVQRAAHMKLNDFVAREIYGPLKMRDTSYLPPPEKRLRIAPTERAGGQFLRGKVHDPKARRMGGVAGHAGVFTTASDLARFARMLLRGGELEGARVLKPETVKQMTSVQTPASVRAKRGLGWDIDSDYSRPRGQVFPVGSYGHTGYTGVCLWIDPVSETFWFLLSNRVHPDPSGNIGPLQRTLGTLSAEAVRPMALDGPPSSPQKSRLEVVPHGIAGLLMAWDMLPSGLMPINGSVEPELLLGGKGRGPQ